MTAPKRRWLRFGLRESFLALIALGCAVGWAYERWSRPPQEMTLRQVVDMVGDEDEIMADCRIENPDDAEALPTQYWLVRKRQKRAAE